MSHDARLPLLSRVDFYRLHEGELISALAQSIAQQVERLHGGSPTAAHEAIGAWAKLSLDVPNGGFAQFFYNHRGDDGVEELARLLDSIDMPKAGALLRDAVAVYRRHESAFGVDNPWDGLFGSIKEFDKLDQVFVKLLLRGDRPWRSGFVHISWSSRATRLATPSTRNSREQSRSSRRTAWWANTSK